MSTPLKVTDGRFDWYRRSIGDAGVSYDGSSRVTGHWLRPDVFDRLSEGQLFSELGVRSYATKEDAESALRRVS